MWTIIAVALAMQSSFEQGVAYFREGRLAQAERAFLESLDESPTHAPSFVFLARVYAATDRVDEAESTLLRGLEHHPTGVGLLNELGSLHLRRGRLEEAEAVFRESLRARPSNVRAVLGLGEALAESARLGEAYVHLAQYQDRPNVQRALGLVAYALNRDEEALSLLGRSVERDPSDVRALVTIGLVHLRRGDSRLARESFDEAVSARPEDAEAHFYLGEMKLGSVELESAVAEYERAIELAPQYLRAHQRLAEALSKLGLQDRAADVLTSALQISSDPRARAETYYLLATVQGRDDEKALDALERARDLSPHDAKVRYLLGITLARLGRSDASRAELAAFRDLEAFEELASKLEAALIAKPNDPAPYQALAELYLEHDRASEAVVYLEKAIALGSEDTGELIELRKKLEVPP